MQDQSKTPVSLLELIRNNNQDAWSRFIYLYKPLIHHWCRSWHVHVNDIEDVTQEVYRALARNIGSYKRESAGAYNPFRVWLATVTRNKIRDYYRERNSLPFAGGGLTHQHILQKIEQVKPDDEADKGAIDAVYQRALELIQVEFEERTWRAFWRMAVDGLPAADVGVELSMSEVAVRKAKSRVLRRLQEELGEQVD
ncbi:MAG: sigma-70 family RNA polymerase sigma factor [Planctomycetes bacterium]|nr:sigma-70 family RNA polymerase sigma factor [Planctomycetota bacterium]